MLSIINKCTKLIYTLNRAKLKSLKVITLLLYSGIIFNKLKKID